jgi:hypothetical protein
MLSLLVSSTQWKGRGKEREWRQAVTNSFLKGEDSNKIKAVIQFKKRLNLLGTITSNFTQTDMGLFNLFKLWKIVDQIS